MNLDDLFGIGEVVPVAVGLPAFGDDLDQHTALRRVGNVGKPLHVGFHVDFGFFVFDQVIFFGFDVDAGVLDGLVGIAAGDFDGEARNGSGRRSCFGWSGLLSWR